MFLFYDHHFYEYHTADTESKNHSKTLKMLPQHLREKSVIEFIELLNFIF